MVRYLFIMVLSTCIPYGLQGQGKAMQNWYWGNKCAMDFTSSPPTIKTHKHQTYTHNSTCISDEKTGKLQFFTYGVHLFNESGDTIGNTGLEMNRISDMLVIPVAAVPGQYLFFANERQVGRNHSLRVFTIDMSATGNVVTGEKKIGNGQSMDLMNRITAVKHCFMDGYWLLGISYPYLFKAFYVSASGVISEPVTTAHHQLFPSDNAGDFVASNDGKYVLFTPYTEKASDECRMYEFNNRCGTFSTTFSRALPAETDWSRSHGAAFSPDNQFVYIAYGYMESQLVQYSVSNPAEHTLIATSENNFNQMALGPDGRLYITTHISGIPANKIDVVQRPNEKGSACGYKEDFLRTKGPSNFHFPNLVHATKGSCSDNPTVDFRIGENRCAGVGIEFTATLTDGAYDSLKWYFNDPSVPGAYSNKSKATHIYNAAGKYRPYLVVWFCTLKDTIFKELEIEALGKPDLGPDLTICKGATVSLGPGTTDAEIWKWSTGSAEKIIEVSEPGTYSVKVSKGQCSMEDEIVVSEHPPIFTALGNEYFICEEQDELVQLDAGEGFRRYRWTPTDDTTQWIIVDKQGGYFVLVEDFRGCKAEDGTVVKSICDMRIWFPSSFTPNGDGLNDVFKGEGQNIVHVEILIYNRWGEEVYHSFDLNSGWDGSYLSNHAASGVYVWKARATGFLNKKKVVNSYYGTVELLR